MAEYIMFHTVHFAYFLLLHPTVLCGYNYFPLPNLDACLINLC